MKLLALDTATEACSAALYLDGEILFRFEIAPRRHADLILSMIDGLLKEAGITLKQLDAIAYGCGPGAFTGVRIATGVAQGLGFAIDRPLIPISTLATLAWAVRDKAPLILPAIDARMNEIYCGLYQTEPRFQNLQSDRVCLPDATELDVNNAYYGVGTGWAKYDSELESALGKQLCGYEGERFPHAKDAVQLALMAYENGAVQKAEDAAPVYLRNKVTG